MDIQGTIVDVVNRRIFDGIISVREGVIDGITGGQVTKPTGFILPGFVDAHVHIESSMVTPAYFAQHVKKYGTLAVIADPHEISNVCGENGFEYMYNEARDSDIGIFFGIPSCVPATPFETSGAIFDAKTIDSLFDKYQPVALSEMMNFPGVVNQVTDVMEKIRVAQKHGKPIDGHAPGLIGKDLGKYIAAGISTDHESFSYDEAREKIERGMKIQIRQGSAAKNFDELYKLIDEYPDMVMLCTDDSHPDTLQQGHIDRIVKMGFAKGLDILNVLQASSINAINHYNLPMGKLQVGDPADFIVVDDLNNLNVIECWKSGQKIHDTRSPKPGKRPQNVVNNFKRNQIEKSKLQVEDKNLPVKIIEAIDGELITKKSMSRLPSENGFLQCDPENDILKMVVVNRYSGKNEVQVGFVKGFGLKNGAFAGSIAHDSHNLIAIGVNDEEIVRSLQAITENNGGICVTNDAKTDQIALPVAGLMANETIENMAVKYNKLDQKVKDLGSKLNAPFMTMAFMSLLVIPELKLGDKGLFDVSTFSFTDLYCEE